MADHTTASDDRLTRGHYITLALLAVVVTVTPGLDTVLVLRQALRSGQRTAFAAAAGICLGALVWGIAAAAGYGRSRK